jgi:hypothetical protein
MRLKIKLYGIYLLEIYIVKKFFDLALVSRNLIGSEANLHNSIEKH